MPNTGKWTTCKSCGRVIWADHSDTDGLCVFCLPPVNGHPVEPEAPADEVNIDFDRGMEEEE